MTTCQVCGVPADAGFFDRSSIVRAPDPGEERSLATFELHRNYCGQLLYFSQFTQPNRPHTEGYVWQIRVNGRQRDPYGSFQHIINPWGMAGFPLGIRLDEGATLEFVIRNTGGAGLRHVGGRLLGRYWYNTIYGGAPNPL